MAAHALTSLILSIALNAIDISLDESLQRLASVLLVLLGPACAVLAWIVMGSRRASDAPSLPTSNADIDGPRETRRVKHAPSNRPGRGRKRGGA